MNNEFDNLIVTHNCADCRTEVTCLYINESDKLKGEYVPAYCSRCASLRGLNGEKAKQYMIDNPNAR